MAHPLLLLSTCGTSLLTHGADPDTRRWLVQIANEATLPEVDQRRFDAYVTSCMERLLKADVATRRRQSAELNSIDAVLEQWNRHQIRHLLIHTDTVVGRATAGMVEAALAHARQSVQLLTAAGLRTDDFPSFREALADLTHEIEEWVSSCIEQDWTVIFNLTGGFKSVNAYLQALGMLCADRCVFLFEGSSALMEIPRLPVKLADAAELREHLVIFRKLAVGYPVSQDDARGIPDSLVLVRDGRVNTSVWGDIVWGRLRKTLLAEASPDESLSRKLVVTDTVSRIFAGMPADLRAEVNEALDGLSAHLDHGRPIPSSSGFRALDGNPGETAAHELFGQGLEGGWRLLGHFEQDDFIADELQTRP